MSDRSYCTMYTNILGVRYCDYYDHGCFKCEDIKVCPDGLDEEDEDEEKWADEN